MGLGGLGPEGQASALLLLWPSSSVSLPLTDTDIAGLSRHPTSFVWQEQMALHFGVFHSESGNVHWGRLREAGFWL